ncbi:MAG: RHS repeat-associated core domain-containing protein, partial [Gemmatimonadaceae bacterium]
VTFGVQPNVGRHVQTTRARRIDNLLHDGAGNVVRQTSTNTASTYTLEDRMPYYDALNRLRVVDHRTATVTGQVGGEQLTFDFEDYRYDALGRRVLVRTRRRCIIIPDHGLCGLHTIRRTVWDGEQELIEIQRPGDDNIPAAELERDVGFSPWQMYVNWPTAPFDVNRYFGRVAYTPGLALDQPASITRFDFQADSTQSASGGQPGVPSSFFRQWPTPFTVIPHWNIRGEADNGTFANGAYRYCPAEGAPRCVEVGWPFSWTAYQQKTFQNIAWHGTLIEQKRDGSGLLYRRNRLLDPSSGRFTQEDPIGLAGGLNLYGFANGDPVSFSDPFGLCVPWCLVAAAWAAYEIGSAAYDVYQAYKTVRDPNASEFAKGAMVAAATASVFGPGGGGTLVIGKMDDLARGVAAGERTLLPRMADDLGSPAANWRRNAGLLREEMAKGKPIRDASVNARGELTNNTGFLRAERQLMQDRGWTYDRGSRMWNPPTR